MNVTRDARKNVNRYAGNNVRKNVIRDGRKNVKRYARTNAEIMFQYMPEILSD